VGWVASSPHRMDGDWYKLHGVTDIEPKRTWCAATPLLGLAGRITFMEELV